jgi:hypothetical protein
MGISSVNTEQSELIASLLALNSALIEALEILKAKYWKDRLFYIILKIRKIYTVLKTILGATNANPYFA